MSPHNASVNEDVVRSRHKELFSLRKASWVMGRDRTLVGLFVGLECAVLVVGEKFTLTRR